MGLDVIFDVIKQKATPRGSVGELQVVRQLLFLVKQNVCEKIKYTLHKNTILS